MIRSNKYDNLKIDIWKLHTEVTQSDYYIKHSSLYLTGILVKLNLWKKLVDSGFIRGWFDEFNKYLNKLNQLVLLL